MTSINEIKEIRLNKKKKLENLGINPYPNQNFRTHDLKTLKKEFKSLIAEKKEVTIAGRIVSLRGQGAIVFADLFDGTSKFQTLLKKDNKISYRDLNLKNSFEIFQENIDEGDFVEFSGLLFVTKRGEETLEVKSWRLLAKSLRPIPEKFYGLKNEDERYRQRYLDIILNEKTRETVEKRSIFWNTVRQFLLQRDFIEVETPILENTPGGADAKPFITHHNALDLDVYLRISVGELWQKKLLIAGLPRVFEIGRVFRNEGMSAEHLQDYTAVEFYQAFSDYREGMKMVRLLFIELAEKTFGTTKINFKDFEIDLTNDWKVYDYVKILEEKFHVNVLTEDVEKITGVLKDLKIDFDQKNLNKEKAVDLLWKSCRKDLIEPGFLINVPVFLEPLAKKNTENPEVVERFQVIIGGSEQGKGFSELNDPIDQESRFNSQEKMRLAGDEEAQRKDDEYVEALEYGMPPAFGFGMSERFFAFLNGTSVRESQIFPLMRPKQD